MLISASQLLLSSIGIVSNCLLRGTAVRGLFSLVNTIGLRFMEALFRLLLQLDFTVCFCVCYDGFAAIIGLTYLRYAFIIVVPVVFESILVDFWEIFRLPTRFCLVFNGVLTEKLK